LNWVFSFQVSVEVGDGGDGGGGGGGGTSLCMLLLLLNHEMLFFSHCKCDGEIGNGNEE
jgi:hypothetical protein